MSDFQSRLRNEYLNRPDTDKKTLQDVTNRLQEHEDDPNKWVYEEYDPNFIIMYLYEHDKRVSCEDAEDFKYWFESRDTTKDSEIDWVNLYDYLDALSKHPDIVRFQTGEPVEVSDQIMYYMIQGLKVAKDVLEPHRGALCAPKFTLF